MAHGFWLLNNKPWAEWILGYWNHWLLPCLALWRKPQRAPQKLCFQVALATYSPDFPHCTSKCVSYVAYTQKLLELAELSCNVCFCKLHKMKLTESLLVRGGMHLWKEDKTREGRISHQRGRVSSLLSTVVEGCHAKGGLVVGLRVCVWHMKGGRASLLTQCWWKVCVCTWTSGPVMRTKQLHFPL